MMGSHCLAANLSGIICAEQALMSRRTITVGGLNRGMGQGACGKPTPRGLKYVSADCYQLSGGRLPDRQGDGSSSFVPQSGAR